jgi:hypothetical protein
MDCPCQGGLTSGTWASITTSGPFDWFFAPGFAPYKAGKVTFSYKSVRPTYSADPSARIKYQTLTAAVFYPKQRDGGPPIGALPMVALQHPTPDDRLRRDHEQEWRMVGRK